MLQLALGDWARHPKALALHPLDCNYQSNSNIIQISKTVASKSAFNPDSFIRIFKLSVLPKPGIFTFSCQNFQILNFLQNFQILHINQNFQILNFNPNLVPLQGLWGVTAQAHQCERFDGPFL